MLSDRSGSADGFAVRYFRGGHCYAVCNHLARRFIGAGHAIERRADGGVWLRYL